MQKISTKQMIFCAVLACIAGVLSGPLSFHFMEWKISFGNIPIMIAGILFGPLLGGMTGFAADFINWLLKPTGGYNPLFGIVAALVGVIAGIIYRSKDGKDDTSLIKAVFTAATCQIICSFLLNTTILVLIYGSTPVLFVTKIIYNIVMIPIMAAVLHGVLKLILPMMKKFNKV